MFSGISKRGFMKALLQRLAISAKLRALTLSFVFPRCQRVQSKEQELPVGNHWGQVTQGQAPILSGCDR